MRISVFLILFFSLVFAEGGRILDIKSGVLDLKDKVLNINSKTLNIAGRTSDIKPTLKDLNVKVSKKEVKITMSADVLFDFDSAKLREKSKNTLEDIARFIKQYKAKEVFVEGHTDSKGSEKYNLKLSERRAESVKRWLVEKGGISSFLIKTKGYGESRPIAPNTNKDGSDNPKGRQKNRRVEIIVRR